jgi:guanine deaminase
MSARKAFRAAAYHCVADPGQVPVGEAIEYIDDGLLIVEDGRIAALGPASELLPTLGDDTPVEDLTGKLLLPGFIDCHVHYAQLDIIAAYGEQLLDWLHRYAYPAEARFADKQHAAEVAEAFLEELLRNGITTALIFATVHPQSVDAIFEAAERRNMRVIAGKVLMDRNCPEQLRDTPESAYADSKALIERWHGKGRLGYAITPRFALTSSAAQLEAAGRLAAEHPDVWVHTHLAENREEVEEIARAFPESRSYLDVYEQFGLVRHRSMFAHCLHVDGDDRAVMAGRQAAGAFCPTSNLFLGSGLFNLQAMTEAGVNVGLATDVGGGTSLSMLRTMSSAYKVLHLQRQPLAASRAVYLATLGAARALGLEDVIGNLTPGKEADFIAVDFAATQITERRTLSAESIDEALFSLIFLGDDRHIASTYILGELPASGS